MIDYMGAPDRGLLGSVPAVLNDPGAALRAARLDGALTVDQLAALVDKVRRRERLPDIQHESVRRQLTAFESGHHRPGRQWRRLIAGALRLPEERLFGLDVAVGLPRPLLADTHVTDATVRNLLNRRAVYAEAEHIFGPRHVQHQVASDMQVISDLITTTPAQLRREMRLAAASYSELLGWLAQDGGDPALAQRYTIDALAHLELLDGVDPGLRAMLMMRRSNIVTTSDPQTSIEYAEAAAHIASALPNGRLQASIARQRALGAFSAGEQRDFTEHLACALDLAQANPVENDLAVYATPAYVVSEAAGGLIALGRSDHVVENLAKYLAQWPDGQQRDHAVAQLRFLRALAVTGNYADALHNVDIAVRSWRATPSIRAQREIRLLARSLRDRSRRDRSLPLNHLRGRIKDAMQGGSSDV